MITMSDQQAKWIEIPDSLLKRGKGKMPVGKRLTLPKLMILSSHLFLQPSPFR